VQRIMDRPRVSEAVAAALPRIGRRTRSAVTCGSSMQMTGIGVRVSDPAAWSLRPSAHNELSRNQQVKPRPQPLPVAGEASYVARPAACAGRLSFGFPPSKTPANALSQLPSSAKLVIEYHGVQCKQRPFSVHIAHVDSPSRRDIFRRTTVKPDLNLVPVVFAC